MGVHPDWSADDRPVTVDGKVASQHMLACPTERWPHRMSMCQTQGIRPGCLKLIEFYELARTWTNLEIVKL
eukprot:1136921-Pelagomonas_calceolata.AAC.1